MPLCPHRASICCVTSASCRAIAGCEARWSPVRRAIRQSCPPPAPARALGLGRRAQRASRKRWAWLLAHVFRAHVDTCPHCGGPMRWVFVKRSENVSSSRSQAAPLESCQADKRDRASAATAWNTASMFQCSRRLLQLEVYGYLRNCRASTPKRFIQR